MARMACCSCTIRLHNVAAEPAGLPPRPYNHTRAKQEAVQVLRWAVRLTARHPLAHPSYSQQVQAGGSAAFSPGAARGAGPPCGRAGGLGSSVPPDSGGGKRAASVGQACTSAGSDSAAELSLALQERGIEARLDAVDAALQVVTSLGRAGWQGRVVAEEERGTGCTASLQWPTLPGALYASECQHGPFSAVHLCRATTPWRTGWR